MESVYHFLSQNSVLLLNGAFVQSATAVRYAKNEPLFVTVLPLYASCLPYTVEVLGGKAITNESLTTCCDMGEGHYYIELHPRNAYVFSPAVPPTPPQTASAPAQLLSFLRGGNVSAARSMLSPSLSASVTDEALGEFFEGVTAVRENTFTPQKGWLLLKEDGTAALCRIEFSHGLIENITFA